MRTTERAWHNAPSSKVEEDNMLEIALAVSAAESGLPRGSAVAPGRAQEHAAPRRQHPLPSAPPYPLAMTQELPDTRDDEQIARALERSLHDIASPKSGASRGHLPGASHHGRQPDTSEDEKLAISLHLEEQKAVINATARRPFTAHVSDKCAGCGDPLMTFLGKYTGMGDFVSVHGQKFHRRCLKCALCGGGLSAQVRCTPDGKFYHPACAREKLEPKCDCCKQFIPGKEGHVRYLTARFWNEKYCPAHATDGTLRCSSCQRYRGGPEETVQFDDGRAICLSCLETMVPDTAAAQSLYDDVLRFYSQLGLPHPERAPMMLVDDSALNEYSAREGGRADGPVTHTRGLTLTERYSTIRVSSMSRRNLFSFSSRMESMPLQQSTVARVQAILVLAGMPRSMTGAVLAHEAMHAWLAMSKYHSLTLQVEEGMCQLLAYLWVEQQQLPAGSSEERLASYVAYQIRTDQSMVYGEGFRLALTAFQQHGLVKLLQCLKATGKFP